MDSPWVRQRDFWVQFRVSDEALLLVIEHYALERPEDTETIVWLSSRGNHGSDLGGTFTEEAAVRWGGFTPRPSEVRYEYDCNGSDREQPGFSPA